ncbi:sigma-70 family RNA polymerase sigma factor [Frankia sp. AiPs1]|uniref:sigma-70 family RNA polymerase sigma factor n=1 Tax=Frankia sp. AiPs1 TaxID=573493 RepID=UPI002044C647|nr:sigma-70 family RNA polymerase sigma factor [Frankia sp. AiPs1]MCM3921306.1 sigma-70 family RNA polymerase sigma factor [Frankia sp. AiPs1]
MVGASGANQVASSGSTLVVASLGSRMAASAARTAASLTTTGRPVTVIADGTLLLGYLNTLLPTAGQATVIQGYHKFIDRLWHALFQEGPPSPTRWVYDFRACVTRALDLATPPRIGRHVIVVDGTRIPRGFYLLLRALRIPMTVFVEADSGLGTTSVQEIRTAMGGPATIALSDNRRNSLPIAQLAGYFRIRAGGAATAVPDVDGRLPALWHTPEFAGLAERLRAYHSRHPRERIGVLVQQKAQVDALYRALGQGTAQFQHGDSFRIPNGRIDLASPGFKITTWESARAVEFDTVVIAELQDVMLDVSSPALPATMEYLVTRARRTVVLAYSGIGDPRLIRSLPLGLVEDQRSMQPAGDVFGLPPPEPAEAGAGTATGPDSASADHLGTDPDDRDLVALLAQEPGPVDANPDSVAASADAVARAHCVLANDGLHGHPDRRILTAAEEVGLAMLMRPDRALHEDLGQSFRRPLHHSDQRARAYDALVLHNQRLVHSIAKKYQGNGLAFEDLSQHGMTGLMRAVQKFDATRGYKFSTYATWWIRQAITRALADEGRLIRLPVHVAEKVNRVRRVLGEMRMPVGHASIPVVASAAHLSEHEAERCLVLLRQEVVSLDQPAGHDGGTVLGELIGLPCPGNDPDEVLDREWHRLTVNAELARLSPKSAEIIRLRFGLDDDNPRTLEQVGQIYGVTRERIRQIEKKAREQLATGIRQAYLDVATMPEPGLASASTQTALHRNRRAATASGPPGAVRGTPRTPAHRPTAGPGPEYSHNPPSDSASTTMAAPGDEPEVSSTSTAATPPVPRIRTPVASRDPFLLTHPATQDYDSELVKVEALSARVRPYVLPHPSRLTGGDFGEIGEPATWRQTQGLYVVSGGYFWSLGGWLGLPDLEPDADSDLARLEIEVDPPQLEAWSSDEPTQPLQVPALLQRDIARLARMTRYRSADVFRRHQASPADSQIGQQ